MTTEASESDEAAIGAKLEAKDSSIEAKISGAISHKKKEETERIFRIHKQKLQELDTWLPELKERIREFFNLSNSVRTVFIQIDDLYHLKRADQAFVVDYIHRLCKDVPIYFKIATLRHASTLYVDRDGQPIGAQERHDYQPIDIDYTFNDFNRTKNQNWQILRAFAKKAGMQPDDISGVFKGAGFARLVMAGGGVPRDVLSLFLEALNTAAATPDGRIGKDEVRILSRSNLERRIDELKQDSQGDEQSELISGIYVLRNFCLEKKSNIFLVQEKLLQQNDSFRDLFYRLMDYRIIHLTATALTHKSQPGTYRAFAIDIGCWSAPR